MNIFKIKQSKISNKLIFASSLLAAWSHILLDSFMHTDMHPFYPVTTANPFLHAVEIIDIYLFTGIGLVITLILWVQLLIKR